MTTANRITSLLCAMVIVLGLVGCKSNPDEGSQYSYYYEYEQDEEDANSNDNTDNAQSGDNAQGSGKDNSTASGNGGSGKKDPSAPIDTNKVGMTAPSGNTNPADYGIKSGSAIENDQEVRKLLKGRTIKMATFNTAVYEANSFTRMMKAFEKEYGCKIKREIIAFDKYNERMKDKILSANESYDIAYIHGYAFFSMIATGAYQPLNNYFTTSDIGGKKQGLDLDKSVECSWNGKIYGLAHYYSVHPMLFFYNKKMFNDAGLEDPRTLYEQGKWTWEKFQEMGAAVSNSANDQYFGDWTISRPETIASFGASPVKYVNGVPTVNIDTKEYRAGLQLCQDMLYGNKKIVRTQGAKDPLQNFFQGGSYIYTEEDDRYIAIMNKIGELNAFQKKASNLGIVPYPFGSTNTSKVYPTGWIEVVASPITSADPRIAVAWQKFVSTYTDPVTDKNSYSKEDQAMIDKLLVNVLPRRIGFTSATTSMGDHEGNLQSSVVHGTDISKAINQFAPLMQQCITATLTQLEKVK